MDVDYNTQIISREETFPLKISEVIPHIVCPLSKKIMLDAAELSCKHCFSNAALIAWYRQNNPRICPIADCPSTLSSKKEVPLTIMLANTFMNAINHPDQLLKDKLVELYTSLPPHQDNQKIKEAIDQFCQGNMKVIDTVMDVILSNQNSERYQLIYDLMNGHHQTALNKQNAWIQEAKFPKIRDSQTQPRSSTSTLPTIQSPPVMLSPSPKPMSPPPPVIIINPKNTQQGAPAQLQGFSSLLPLNQFNTISNSTTGNPFSSAFTQTSGLSYLTRDGDIILPPSTPDIGARTIQRTPNTRSKSKRPLNGQVEQSDQKRQRRNSDDRSVTEVDDPNVGVTQDGSLKDQPSSSNPSDLGSETRQGNDVSTEYQESFVYHDDLAYDERNLIDMIHTTPTKHFDLSFITSDNANTPDKKGNYPLHLFISTNSKSSKNLENIVNALLEQGAQINAQDANGDTSLHLAVSKSLYNIVAFLLTKGASTNIKNNDLKIPADFAQGPKIIKALKDHKTS